MSDRIYDDSEPESTENIALVAQACRGILTKRHCKHETISYDRVKYFNYFEVNLWSLSELYSLSERLLEKPKCCLIRAKLKNHEKRRHMLRRAIDRTDGDATLLPYRCHWFALDVDGYDTSSGDLVLDTHRVLLALPSGFQDVECFAVASASYGIKTGIHMRLFFWSQTIVSNSDLLKLLRGNKANVDTALYENPVQPIYTAAPIFSDGMIDPVKQRIVWIQGQYSCVNVPSEYIHAKGMPEVKYNKIEADAQATKYLLQISRLSPGERHPGLIKWCIPLGKLIGQGHLDRNETIDRAFNHCGFWHGRRETKKDMDTIIYAIDLGIDSMGE